MQKHLNDDSLLALHRQLVFSGFMQHVPIALMVMVFGAAFGLAATQKGLSEMQILWMSAIVFAGVSQFAALDLWGAQVPLMPLIVTVFAINARHLLMGASLYPWLQHLPGRSRYGVMVLASDVNWAMSLQAFAKQQPGLGLLVGGGLALWTFWLLGTGMGLFFGSIVSNGKALGLDMVMACFLWAMTLSGSVNRRLIAIWGIAATASLWAYRFLPENSHVVAGALAGGLLGACWPEEQTHVD